MKILGAIALSLSLLSSCAFGSGQVTKDFSADLDYRELPKNCPDAINMIRELTDKVENSTVSLEETKGDEELEQLRREQYRHAGRFYKKLMESDILIPVVTYCPYKDFEAMYLEFKDRRDFYLSWSY